LERRSKDIAVSFTMAGARSRDELARLFQETVQGADPFAAVDFGLEMAERFGADGELDTGGCMATLASLLLNREQPGDVARAAETSRAVLANLPAEMESSRYRVQYDLGVALTKIEEHGSSTLLEEALTVVDAMGGAGNDADRAELQVEVLEGVYNALVRSPQHAPVHALTERTCRTLVQLAPGDAKNNMNLGAILCVVGKVEDGLLSYRAALELMDKPAGRGGLTTADKAKLGAAMETAQKQMTGELPREGLLIRAADGGVAVVTGEVLTGNIQSD